MYTDPKTQDGRNKTHVYEKDSENPGKGKINGYIPAQLILLALHVLASTQATLYI
jgi:hypothetical protein